MLPQAKHGSGKYGSVADFLVSIEDGSQDTKPKVRRPKIILEKRILFIICKIILLKNKETILTSLEHQSHPLSSHENNKKPNTRGSINSMIAAKHPAPPAAPVRAPLKHPCAGLPPCSLNSFEAPKIMPTIPPKIVNSNKIINQPGICVKF